MNKIKLSFLSFFCICSISLWAQSNYVLTPAEQSQLQAQIENVHKSLTTMKVYFIQEKHSDLFLKPVVQEGEMLYKSPDKLKWHYQTPQEMTLVFNEKKILLKQSGKWIENPNKMLGELGQLIIQTINGNNLQKSPHFETKYEKNKNGQVEIVLVPLAKRLKSFYKEILVVLEKDKFVASQVIMKESNNDVTKIIFSKHQLNIEISDQNFTK